MTFQTSVSRWIGKPTNTQSPKPWTIDQVCTILRKKNIAKDNENTHIWTWRVLVWKESFCISLHYNVPTVDDLYGCFRCSVIIHGWVLREYKGDWALQLQCIVGVVVAANATQLQIFKYKTFMNNTHLLHLPETPEVRVGN